MSEWTFITNHARVLLEIERKPDSRLRDIAAAIDITERATQRIVTELVDAGYLKKIKEGRRNRYELKLDKPMRAPEVRATEVGAFLKVLSSGKR